MAFPVHLQSLRILPPPWSLAPTQGQGHSPQLSMAEGQVDGELEGWELSLEDAASALGVDRGAKCGVRCVQPQSPLGNNLHLGRQGQV